MDHKEKELLIIASEGGRYRHGGVARHVNEIAKSLSDEVSVTVIVVPSYCLSDLPIEDSIEEEIWNGAHYIYLICADHAQCLRSERFDTRDYVAAAEKMYILLSNLLPRNVDAILLEDHYEAGLAFHLVSRCRRKGFSNFAHLPLSARFSYFEKGVDESRQQVLEAAAMVGSETIITPSYYAMRTVRNVYPVSSGRIRVVPLAVKGVESNQLRLSTRPKTIVTIARFSDQKGWDSFLATAKLIEQSGIEPTWHLIGDGVNREKVLDRLTTFVPGNRVRADRHLRAEDQLPEAMLESAVFFLPSSYETFGFAPLEAAAHGVVPVVTGIGGFEEIWGRLDMTFVPGHIGLASERIVALLSNPAYRMAQAKVAHKVSTEFSWDSHCSQLKDIVFGR